MSPRLGRPKTLQDAVVLYARAPATLADDLDRWVEELRAANIGMAISRADLIRNILIKAVEEHRAATPTKLPSKKRTR